MHCTDAEAQRVNEITDGIIGASIEVHRALGPGLLESAYEERLCFELVAQGLAIECLRLRRSPVGLLINFNVPVLKQGLKRIVHNLREDRPQQSSTVVG